MKLELLNKSQYKNDSLGEITFYYQFTQQMGLDMFYGISSYLLNEIRVDNYRRPILEGLKKHKIGGDK